MQELKELIKRCKHKILNGGKCPMLVEIRDKYLNHYGISNRHIKPYKGSMNDKVGIKIANAYEELEHSPDNFLVKICYEQLAREVLNQFDFLNERENIIYEPFTSEGEPYENSYEMLKDIHQNHLFFFKTESGFGENNSSESNKMLEKTDFKYNGYEFVINDIFRIVHDIFGHAMNGYSFGPKGEDKEFLIIYSKKKLETENIDYFIYGHRHLPMVLDLGKNSKYINLGDWISYFTYGVFEHDFQLKTFEKQE
jgi:hypothetical protein